MKSLLFFFLFFLPLSLQAKPIIEQKDFSLSLKGYYKNLFLTSRGLLDDDPFVGDVNRLRLEWDSQFLKHFSLKIIWDNELVGGDWVNSFQFNARQALRESGYLDLHWGPNRDPDFSYSQNLYRAYLKMDFGKTSLTVGRQKIDWGSARIFSPADLFTPLTLFDVEKEEKPGVDAGNLLIRIGESTKLNLVYTADNNFDESRLGLRITQTIRHFDVALYGGRFLQDYIFGVDTAGEIGGLGIRGELNYNQAHFGKNFIQASLEVDYGFPNSFYILGGYFYNGQATSVIRPLFLFHENSAQPIKTQNPHFLDVQMRYDFTPLWKGNILVVYDLVGTSFFINPEMTYQAFSWLDLSAGAFFPLGCAEGEFTQLPNLYYFETRISF